MRQRSLLVGLITVLAVGLFLAGCDNAEQGRILRYEKGVYLGQADQPLSAEEQDDLRQRTRLQKDY